MIGGGSGGVRAARIAASLGANVGLYGPRFGGTCVNLGCVPKKLFAYASEYKSHFEDSVPFGWDATVPHFDWSTLLRNKDTEIKRLNGVYQRILENSGVQIFQGRGLLRGPNTILVNEQLVTAKHILIATGSRVHLPNIDGIEHALTSDDFFGSLNYQSASYCGRRIHRRRICLNPEEFRCRHSGCPSRATATQIV